MANGLKTFIKVVSLKTIKIITLYLSFFVGFAYSNVLLSAEYVLKVGVVPQFEQRHIFESWKPILFELEKLTNLKFELVGSPKIPEFEKQFNKGIYDLAYMNPYHVVKAFESQRYIPLLREREKIKGVLVVNSSSEISTVQQLQGKTIAFPSPNALGASLLMRALLIKKFTVIFKPKYVQTHTSVYFHVAKNLVAAGGGVDRTFAKQPLALKEKLKVIYETPEFVSHPIVIHPRISINNRELIKKSLIKLFNTKKGKALFENIPITDLVDANIKDYTPLTKFNLDKFYEK